MTIESLEQAVVALYKASSEGYTIGVFHITESNLRHCLRNTHSLYMSKDNIPDIDEEVLKLKLPGSTLYGVPLKVLE